MPLQVRRAWTTAASISRGPSAGNAFRLRPGEPSIRGDDAGRHCGVDQLVEGFVRGKALKVGSLEQADAGHGKFGAGHRDDPNRPIVARVGLPAEFGQRPGHRMVSNRSNIGDIAQLHGELLRVGDTAERPRKGGRNDHGPVAGSVQQMVAQGADVVQPNKIGAPRPERQRGVAKRGSIRFVLPDAPWVCMKGCSGPDCSARARSEVGTESPVVGA